MTLVIDPLLSGPPVPARRLPGRHTSISRGRHRGSPAPAAVPGRITFFDGVRAPRAVAAPHSQTRTVGGANVPRPPSVQISSAPRPRRASHRRPTRVRVAAMVGLGAFVLSFTVATAVVQTSAGATLDGSSSVGSETIVARAGDTLWTIARRIDPVGDIDPLVAELVRLNGASIAAGQTVRLP